MSLETADSVVMMLIKRNTITPTNKGPALMTHADNQSGGSLQVLKEEHSRIAWRIADRCRTLDGTYPFLTATDCITQTLTNIAGAISMYVLTTGGCTTTTATITETGGRPRWT